MFIEDAKLMGLTRKIGPAVGGAINATGGGETRVNLTALATGIGYPATVEIHAYGAECYVYQGGSAVALPTVAGAVKRTVVTKNGWRLITVDSAADAYVVCEGTGTDTGTLICTRLDRVAV